MLFYGFDSSFPTGVFLVEDFKVRRTGYNLVPTIIERFPSRIKVQAFTAEKAPLTTAPAELAASYFSIHDCIGRDRICNHGYCVAIRK